MNTGNRHFPIGIETFSKIRENDLVYVDKTDLIYDLVSKNGYYFLSRPRRFGKSLLLSTIHSFFDGRRELFEGLDISLRNHSWEKHPVFHLNLVNANLSSEHGLEDIIVQHLEYWEREFGISTNARQLPQRFYAVIRRAVETSGQQAVVLIDEYDKPLISTFGDEELHNKFRAILKPLYATLKAADQYICFAMITGVSRFSRLSIFSDINNLIDISLDNRYASICGITEDEMIRDCMHGIEKIAAATNSSIDEAIAVLKKNYDGYHFTSKCPDIYNPFSLFNAFEKGEFGSYWFATGTPTFLVKALRNSGAYLPDILNSEVDTTQLSDIDSYSTSSISLLFQTGYLTIKKYDPEYDSYLLGMPNREVANGFFKDLLPIYMDDHDRNSLSVVRDFCRKVNSGDADGFISALQAFLADIPYHLSKNKPEIYFENNLYIIFKLMGFTVQTEYATSSGRIDILVTTKKFIYVIELKLNGTAEDAIRQIEEKDYAIPFSCNSQTIFRIGISFSPKTRNISRWIIA